MKEREREEGEERRGEGGRRREERRRRGKKEERREREGSHTCKYFEYSFSNIVVDVSEVNIFACFQLVEGPLALDFGAHNAIPCF